MSLRLWSEIETVGDLIQALKYMPPDARVRIYDFKGETIQKIEIVEHRRSAGVVALLTPDGQKDGA